VALLKASGPVAVFTASAILLVILCLDVGILGPRSTGRALEEIAH
jgi:putative MFS transporter